MRVAPVRARRRRLGYGRTLLTSLLVGLVLTVCSATLVVLASRGSGLAPRLPAQPGAVRWDEREVLTVLILGTAVNPPSSGPTASIAVASFNPGSRRASLLAIPSNLWVTVPGYGQTTIDQAYADGGPRLALLTVESVTHVPIPYYLVAGPTAFGDVVEALGGVPMRLSAADAAAVDRHPGVMRLTAGQQLLSGASALAYIESAPNGGDGSPPQPISRLLAAIGSAVLSGATGLQPPALVEALAGAVTTNFPFDQMPDLLRAFTASPHPRVAHALFDAGTRAVSSYRAGGIGVLLPDRQLIASFCQQLFSDPQLHGGHGVRVLNGSGVPGAAAGLADWLKQGGIRVRGFGSASSFNQPTTQVLLDPRASAADVYVARATATLLEVPLVLSPRGSPRDPIVVIIGRDYQDPTQQ